MSKFRYNVRNYNLKNKKYSNQNIKFKSKINN